MSDDVIDRRKYTMSVDVEAVFVGPGRQRSGFGYRHVDEEVVEQLLFRALTLAEASANAAAHDMVIDPASEKEEVCRVGLRLHFKEPKQK